MILHIMPSDKFLPSFIEFIERNFQIERHRFIFLIDKEKLNYSLRHKDEIIWISSKFQFFKLLKYLNIADKIILHGLWSKKILYVLYYQPWLLKKCYWVMWGGDFYFPEKQIWIKRQIIKKIRHFITYIKGDYELVRKWYSAEGEYHECFMYPSNLYKEKILTKNKKKQNRINIQIGNSATMSNHHFEILDELAKYKNENIRIFAPLSYGNKENAQKVIKKGKAIFKNKFVPLVKFMRLEEYLNFLAHIDIGIFAHDRQQGMGNIITLLGWGKKVYMRSDITPWKMFEEKGIKVYDFKKGIDLELIDEEIKKTNINIIKEHFSEKKLREQLKNLFD